MKTAMALTDFICLSRTPETEMALYMIGMRVSGKIKSSSKKRAERNINGQITVFLAHSRYTYFLLHILQVNVLDICISKVLYNIYIPVNNRNSKRK